jgi:hypothetical protein
MKTYHEPHATKKFCILYSEKNNIIHELHFGFQ